MERELNTPLYYLWYIPSIGILLFGIFVNNFNWIQVELNKSELIFIRILIIIIGILAMQNTSIIVFKKIYPWYLFTTLIILLILDIIGLAIDLHIQ